MSLDTNTIEALGEALDDEYKARATYEAVMEKFGRQRPFSNIMQAEVRHANALLRIFRDYNVTPPPDRWTGNVTAPDSLRDAYALGVQAEIENEAMYQKLRSMTNHPRVLRVFENLRSASQNNHLRAFQRSLGRVDNNSNKRSYRLSDWSLSSEILAHSENNDHEKGHGHGKDKSGDHEKGHGHGKGKSGDSEKGHGHGKGKGDDHEKGHGHGKGKSGVSEKGHGHGKGKSGDHKKGHGHGKDKSGDHKKGHGHGKN